MGRTAGAGAAPSAPSDNRPSSADQAPPFVRAMNTPATRTSHLRGSRPLRRRRRFPGGSRHARTLAGLRIGVEGGLVGIELGSTNSAVGGWRDGKAELIPNSLGHTLTPSCVSIDPETDSVLVGLAARERQSTHPDLTATAFKRYMGSSRITHLGKREFQPEELSALVLRQLKSDAEAYLGEPVTEAVITVPAYFNAKQRKATRRD